MRRTARGWRTSGGGMLDFRRPRSTRPRNASGRASEHRAIVTVERLSDRGDDRVAEAAWTGGVEASSSRPTPALLRRYYGAFDPRYQRFHVTGEDFGVDH